MQEINQEKFGDFIECLRKEKKMTQRELGERLFVSDKTVSKWERGASLPSIELLLPMAEVLEVSVTELLQGERKQAAQKADVAVQQEAVLDQKLRERRKRWQGVFALTVGAVIGLLGLFWKQTVSSEIFKDMCLFAGMMLVFAGWLCFFAKETLPTYYDENRIGFVTQGIFRIHLAGLAINNGNWPRMCQFLRVYTLGAAVGYPLGGLAVTQFWGQAQWESCQSAVVVVGMGLMLIALYGIGKRYE